VILAHSLNYVNNMTSYTKPEVRSILHWRQKRTKPWPQIHNAENLVKFGRVVFEICEQTDKQTDRQTDRHTDTLIAKLCTPTGREVTTSSSCTVSKISSSFLFVIFDRKSRLFPGTSAADDLIGLGVTKLDFFGCHGSFMGR